MKKILILLLPTLLFTACGFSGFVNSLEKQYNSIVDYQAKYRILMDGNGFDVEEIYQNKGQYHRILIWSEKYQQEIILEGDKVRLKNHHYPGVVEGSRENFKLPSFSLIQLLQGVVENKESIKIISGNQIEVNNGEMVIYYQDNQIKEVKLIIGENELLVKYENIEINSRN
ncbi:hypothetical protein SAMN02745227_02108 [Anaerobranca californiensis DSM 14826]|uniref:Uncharacterized protein n=1 Tax=Anaerobranca californiensis DSM 14826 TaxID=1120989 RepID=A0A1M6RU77_9FIRM|nr:hypothetical protein [Anaerobranca californiensis]SHK35996.1 hypothetical protein SAMN02745227_02108 [Anaerobranca californiensis DSM 14826]